MHITTKRSQVKYRFVKEISWQLEEILTRQVNPQRRNHDTYVPWLSQKYFLVTHTESHTELESSNGRPYSTVAHVSQLKAWRSWNEDDDDSNKNSDDELGMQRLKRTVRKPVCYGDFRPGR
ncbi:hypothetical protein AVEN_226489-1 [Araneus ventricosus]|uniref:Uncharacterized protein n=1 Tax=Araneus ventricosus TaxID=182803 RepID=A0A4Y2E1H5_ARAVE|nr:hypothetical protein AVEN_226489-1 [Araneus ventricosus]